MRKSKNIKLYSEEEMQEINMYLTDELISVQRRLVEYEEKERNQPYPTMQTIYGVPIFSHLKGNMFGFIFPHDLTMQMIVRQNNQFPFLGINGYVGLKIPTKITDKQSKDIYNIQKKIWELLDVIYKAGYYP